MSRWYEIDPADRFQFVARGRIGRSVLLRKRRGGPAFPPIDAPMRGTPAVLCNPFGARLTSKSPAPL